MLAADLTPAMSDAGYRVVGLDLPDLDIADEDSVRAALRTVTPDLVVNAAAWTDVDGAEADPAGARRANALGPGVLARVCAADRPRLLHFGTDYVFDGNASRPYREDDPTAPLNVYGASKLEGEQRVRTALPSRHLVIRSSWLYGAAGRSFPATILARAAAGEDVSVVSDQFGNPTWSADLAAASVALLDAGATGTVHFASRDHCSWYDLARAICSEYAERSGTPAVAVRPIRSADRPTPAARPSWSALDTRRYAALTGQQPPSWRDALRRFLDAHMEALTHQGG